MNEWPILGNLLHCPCHLYESIYYWMQNWAPHRLVYSKVYVDMENLFLFLFCDLFVKNEDASCYARPIHGIGALAILSHTMTGNRQEVVERVWQKYRLSKESMWSESSTYTFEYIKRWGAQLCIRWYKDPNRWHGHFKCALRCERNTALTI